VPATLVYACEKIGGGHDQNIIFAPPDVGWLKSHATAKYSYTQQLSRFHVDLIGRRESNPQSGREPDHHLMLATTERALSGL
jgi:hypothetical protein